ncbi:MAG: hypothetical protein KAJ40_02555 [Alphaproteobacteria bacterium]|nr:hypothetical protein [Alphaproteobacteria bacterium]
MYKQRKNPAMNRASQSSVSNEYSSHSYKKVNELGLSSLPALLERWLPDGKIQGHEYVALNPKRADRKAGSFKINLHSGKWSDFATGDKGGDVISLAAYLFGLSQLDPLDNLLEMIEAEGIGIAYKPEVADALRNLHQSNRPAFMDLRHKLKKAQVGVTFLDKFIQERALETGEIVSEPDHLDIAREVIAMIGHDNILCSQSHTWLWHGHGVWKPVHDRVLKQHIQKYMEDSRLGVMRGKVDSVSDVLQTEIHRPEHEWNANNATINVLNGELLWDGVKWQSQKHCREHYRTTQVPIAYDPSADCPRFKRFLQEIFDGDSDGSDKAQLILEMIGYTLVSHAKFEHFVLLVGSGANGKSVVLELIRVLLGKDNVCAVQPSKFSNSFQRAHLHMKLANLVTEIAEGAVVADAELKAITSGELTTAEHKNKDPFDFQPFSTCWFGTNHMPHTRDFSDALFRRALVIPFNQKFEGAKADKNLRHKLQAELSGVMYLALQAYGDVLNRGVFTEPQSCIEAKKEWRKEADQVVQFVEEYCVLDKNSEITSGALYENYKAWADNAGITRKLNQKNFSNRLVRLGCKLHKGTAGKRMIKGIRIGWET